EPFRRELRDAARQLERGRVAGLEMRSVIHLEELAVNRVGDLLATVAGGDVEQSRRAVDQLLALVVPVIDALAAHQEPRLLLEVAVRREGHPVVFERIGAVLHGRFLPRDAGPWPHRRPVGRRNSDGQSMAPARPADRASMSRWAGPRDGVGAIPATGA